MTARSRSGTPRSFELRLRLGLSLMLVPLSLASAMLLVGLLRVTSDQTYISGEIADELTTISELRREVGHASYLVTARSAPDAEEQLQVLSRSVDRRLSQAREFDEPEERRLSRDAASAWSEGLAAARRSFGGGADEGGPDAAEAVRRFDRAAAHLADMDNISRDEIRASIEASTARSNRFVVAGVVVGLLVLGGNLLLIRRLLSATLSPLRQLTAGVSEFSVDDLGRRINVEGDREFQAVGQSFNGMADRLEAALHSLEHRTFHDALTGLPNRASLARGLDRPGAPGRACLMFGLDGFKSVNDGLGHAAGDEALAQIGRRIEETLGPEDLVARLGGDEFAVVLDNDVSVEEIERVAERVIRRIEEPVEIAGRSVVLHASGGIARVNEGDEPMDVLRRADVALSVAKGAGTRHVRWFLPDMLAEVERKLELDTDLRRAVERGEIEVHYQPTVRIATGRVAGVEALARWRHPQHGLIPPASFIPVAEANGSIVALGGQVLVTACRQVKAWQQLTGLEHLTLSVNVSGSQLHDPVIIVHVADALKNSGLAPSSLTLEVTETVMADPDAVARVHKLKESGLRVAIDDFGTGYSSLSYLQRLPIDVLKIDKSFIDDLGARADRAAFASAIIRMGQSLGLETVAEGVENVDQLQVLASVGCDLVQGYFYARPAPPAIIESRLLELASGHERALPAGGGKALVRVSIGPLGSEGAREWLRHAHWAIDELERGSLLPGGVPTSVILMMRSYVHRWTIAAMESDEFVWTSDEDTQLLAVMMRYWRPVSEALAATAGSELISEQAGAFSEALAHALLIALAAADPDARAVEAATLARTWPSHGAP